MRIAYLGQMADVAHENGIAKKLRTQITHWLGAGHAVRYFSLPRSTAVWPGFAPVETELVPRRHPLLRPLQSLALARRIRAWRPDAIYFRYAYHSAGLPALFAAIPTVAEINSDDLTEYPLTLSAPKLAYHRLTRGRVLRRVRGFVPVTRELGTRFAGFGAPIEVLANSIALDEFTPAPAPPPGPPRLLFIGTAGTPWHGLERVAELAHLLPEAHVDVVGVTPDDWARTVGPAAPPPANLTLHGPLPRARYAPLVAHATAAIGSLALYKNAMTEACPLKVREYLACGLPVLAAYTDTDIPPAAPYFLALPNNADPLAPLRDRIRAWLAPWQSGRVPRAAVAHLDTSVKETQRLAFVARIAAAAPRP
jgi:glycosyltransferase involved in cell wall biosynthesis